MSQQVLEGYERAAGDLIAPYEAVSSAAFLSPVMPYFPEPSARVLDIGAGTGRDAAWLTSKGYTVTAVEPVAEFRHAGQSLHSEAAIHWIDDQLPDLRNTCDRQEQYDVLLIAGVWHHLTAAERARALPPLHRLTAQSGCLALSLRSGCAAPDRRSYPVRASDTVALFQQAGFDMLAQREVRSQQLGNRSAGVTWTWLVLRAGEKIPT